MNFAAKKKSQGFNMAEFLKKLYDEIENRKYSFFMLYRDGKCDYEEFVNSLHQK